MGGLAAWLNCCAFFFQALSAVRFWFAVCQFVLPDFALSASGVGCLALAAGFLTAAFLAFGLSATVSSAGLDLRAGATVGVQSRVATIWTFTL